MNGVRRELRVFFLALQFLTRVPVPAWVGFDPVLMRHAARHFPLVGALVGLFGAAVALVADRWWPPAVAATLAVAATVWLTAAFHEDGLADTFDALLGAAPREKALAIMKDSRIGTYGAAALGLGLALRVLLLAELLARGPMTAAVVLVAAHTAGRSAAVALMASLPYARSEGEAATQAKVGTLTREVSSTDTACAVTVGLAALAAAGTWHAAPLAAAAAALAAAGLVATLQRWLRRRLGGHTGDTLGATALLGEIAVLLAFSAAGAA